jgi:hypothetical protein
MKSRPRVAVLYLPDIRRLLFAGGTRDLSSMGLWLMNVATQPIGTSKELGNTEGFDPREDTVAKITLVSEAESRVSVEQDGKRLDWQLSPQCAAAKARLIQDLALSQGKGHQYLEDSGDIELVASLSEWGGPVWKDSLRGAIGR